MEWLDKMVGPLSIQQWGLAVFLLIVAFTIFNMVSGKKGKAEAGGLTRARCIACGWEGNVSRFHRTCPKCGNQITRLSKNEA